MSLGFILRPRLLSAAMLAGSATNGIAAAFPVSALADPQPKVVVRSNAAATSPHQLQVTVDFGADVAIDTVAAMFTNLIAGATWTIYATPAAAGQPYDVPANQLFAGAFGVAPAVPGRQRHALWTGAAVTRRWLRINFTVPSLAPAFISVGQLLIGQRWEPADQFGNFELGASRTIDDRSVKRALQGGETHVERGARVPGWSAVWSALTHAEMRTLWAILADIGESAPVVIVEDPTASAGQNEAMHYGMIERIETIERTQVDKNRLELRIREMM